ncbi:Alpha/Beta hydrolase protein [Trichoderma asperelloides]|nr:Alpha/Beta hydrolase protein [Trichoderma asperelloides]
MENLLSTANIPPEFLKSVYMIGKVPRKALISEPRVSYSLYIPPDHYKNILHAQANGTLQAASRKLPLLVFIHGTLRDDSYAERGLIPFAESTPCAIMAPLFPAGLDSSADLDSYKLLRSPTLRSDLAFLDMLNEVAYRWPGIDTTKIFLMGYSGGAQFAHRFLYLYPERLAAVSIGAPGSVTILDHSTSWPTGIADVKELFGKHIDINLIKQVKIQLVVGDADVEVHGGMEFWIWLQKFKAAKGADLSSNVQPNMEWNKTPNKEIVQNRLGILKRLQALWQEDGIDAQLEIIEGTKHESLKCQNHSLKFLQPLIQE